MWRVRPQENKLSKVEEEQEASEEQQEVPKEKFCKEPNMLLLWEERPHRKRLFQEKERCRTRYCQACVQKHRKARTDRNRIWTDYY